MLLCSSIYVYYSEVNANLKLKRGLCYMNFLRFVEFIKFVKLNFLCKVRTPEIMSTSHYPCLLNLTNNEIIRISKKKFSVGRSLKSDYVLNGSSISRIHFHIEKREETWILQDISTNGTLVNKILLKSEIKNLRNGDLIEFVGGTLRLKYKDSEEAMIDNDSIAIIDLDQVITSPTGNSLPSVSNDHSYERREADREQTSSVGDVIDLTSFPDSPSSTGQNRGQKRNSVEVPKETPLKKNKHMEDSSEEPKLECKLEASELECSICQELYINATTLNCAHSFCSSCIMRWRSQRNHCPICRRPIEFANPSMVLDNLVKKLVSAMDQNNREQRNKMVADRTAQIIPPASPNAEFDYNTASERSDDSDFSFGMEEDSDSEDVEEVYRTYIWNSWVVDHDDVEGYDF
ncbi:E3 ubiquitin-protein ligase CHFR-like [Harmonia axyridis]|uniref:E3 ubiquitin-protein ligase CHFR-like n=1 Tax=Harmonia axyridis TaxID=115357 RepID=UPI001E278612|nr:E3 ubiquitin-protein ligase CHFR-like [Harmonia axyridis]